MCTVPVRMPGGGGLPVWSALTGGPTVDYCIAAAAVAAAAAAAAARYREAIQEVTFSSGFGYDSVRDAEGSRAADGQYGRLRRGMAPPGLLGCARRCQRYGVRQKHQIRSWQRGHTQLPSSVGYESKGWLWFHSVLSLALALPQGSIRTGAQSAVLRPAVGSGGARRFRLHGPFWVPCQCAFCKVVAPAIILRQLE